MEALSWESLCSLPTRSVFLGASFFVICRRGLTVEALSLHSLCSLPISSVFIVTSLFVICRRGLTVEALNSDSLCSLPYPFGLPWYVTVCYLSSWLDSGGLELTLAVFPSYSFSLS